MKTTLKKFIAYEFKGNGKYYLNSYGKRTLNKSEFSKFRTHNPELIQSISEVQNDAPRGGKVGDFVIVEFTNEFHDIANVYNENKKFQSESIANAKALEIEAVNELAKLITRIEGEEMNATAGRLGVALNGKNIDKNIFWKAVKLIRKGN